MRLAMLLVLLGLALPAQVPPRVLLVLDSRSGAVMGQGLTAGAEAALQASWPAARLVVLNTSAALKPGAFAGVQGCLLFLQAGRARRVFQRALAAGVPSLDLGQAHLSGQRAPPSAYADAAAQAEAGAWWLGEPFAHEQVFAFFGRGKTDRVLATRFARAFKALGPQRAVGRPARLPTSSRSLKKLLKRQQAAGITAYFCAASRSEALVLARAARAIRPPPLVLLSSQVLGAGPAPPEGQPFLPQGTMVLDRDLPGPEALKSWDQAGSILAMQAPAGAWELAAFDGVQALVRARAQAQESNQGPMQLLAQGRVLSARGSWADTLARDDPQRIPFIPLIMHEGRLRPFPPLDLQQPLERPRRIPYTTSSGLGGLPQWNTRRYRARSGTHVCQFTWGTGAERTIDAELLAMKLSTGGRLPVVDHLVRKKIMARLLGISGQKFGAQADGSFKAGSLLISMTTRVNRRRDRPKLVWRVLVAGDDAAAGGRAFGSWCQVYSSFIYRTIFKNYDLLDEPIGLEELPRLVGLGRKAGPYVLGSREDVLYRLIDRFAGSMALTAAHEIGHLCGLGHDTVSPTSLMNVREGAGLNYRSGKFIAAHWGRLERLLGTFGSDRR